MSTPSTVRAWDAGPQPGREVDTVRDIDGDVLKTYPRPRPQKSRGIQPTLFDLEGASA